MTWQKTSQHSFKLFAKGFCPSMEEFFNLLHTCQKERDLSHTLFIHACMCGYGLEAQTSLGNHLVSLFVDMGSVCLAQQVFDKLLHHDASSWDSLIVYYANHQGAQKALLLYETMVDDVSLHPCVFVALLRCCIALKDIKIGYRIHSDISKKGILKEDKFLACTLIHMYAKCGSVEKAQEVFDALQVRNIVLWNALLSAYIEQGQGDEALHRFKAMKKDGMISDATTLVYVLKSCGMIRDVLQGYEVHTEVVKTGWLEENVFIASALVSMYGKCGFLNDAQEVFDKLPVQNEVSWIALIAALVEHGCSGEALICHKLMKDKGISPHPATLVCSLKACGSIGAIMHGQELHSEIINKGLEGECVIGNILIDMYSKCGSLLEAQDVFDKLVDRNIISWTALIGGLVEFEYSESALHLLEQMQLLHLIPDAATSICGLKACGSLEAVAKGHEIHTFVVKHGHVESDNFFGVTLVHMYAKCGALQEAQQIFMNLREKSVVAWNALLAGYAEHGYTTEALNCFDQMVNEDIFVDHTTLVYCLNVCGSLHNATRGQQIHDLVIKRGLEEDKLLGNNLVDMYAGCRLLAEAHEVLIKLPHSTPISWTSLIAGYVDHGCIEEALKCFIQARNESIACNSYMFVCTLKACILTAALEMGRELHTLIVKQGVLEEDALVASALVSLYAKCGLIEEARTVLKKLSARDLISWTALLRGCVDFGYHEEALCCFEQMRQEGITPDSVAFVCNLSACSSTGAAVMGVRMHKEISMLGLETELTVGNALVDMYAKCGRIRAARCVFEKLPVQDIVSSNALLTGYAHLGESASVFHIVDRIIEGRNQPDMYTFYSVLNVCSHAGLLTVGQLYFSALIVAFDLMPTFEHFTCMVDLFARAACIESAMEFVKKMPFQPDLVVWHVILGACRMHGYMKLGRHAFKQAMCLNERDATAYVNMSNLFVDAKTQMQQ